MKTRLQRLWEDLRSSYWVIPGLMAFLAGGLAHLVRWLDGISNPELERLVRNLPEFGVGPARDLLSLIASASITVTGVVFSITIVVLNMASAQFGPRLLRNFMEHGGTQRALGMFSATFVFSIVALAAIDHGASVALTVTTALGLGAASLLFLIYFIHHVSVFIQAPRILDDVATQLETSFRSAFVARDSSTDEPSAEADAQRRWDAEDSDREAEPVSIPSPVSGYVQAIDVDGLVEFARDCGTRIELLCRPGHFLLEGAPVARLFPAPHRGGAESSGASCDNTDPIKRAVLTGPERTPTQDPEFALHQLVEVALRALSPGINDPYTAINSLDRIGAALAVLARRRIPDGVHRDDDGVPRVTIPSHSYAGLVDSAFDQIRQNGCSQASVLIRLVEVITVLGRCEAPASFRDALRTHALAARDAGSDSLAFAKDRRDFAKRLAEAGEALDLALPMNGDPAASAAPSAAMERGHGSHRPDA